MSKSFFEQEARRLQVINQALELKPCPCCGSVNLYCGPAAALAYGIKCTSCGLKVTRDLPERAPKGVDSVAVTIQSAADAWNKRENTDGITCRPLTGDTVVA